MLVEITDVLMFELAYFTFYGHFGKLDRLGSVSYISMWYISIPENGW